MNFNDYILEKWSLSKIWNLRQDKKLLKPEWQRELKLEKGHENRFVIAALDGDLNQSWILADLKSCGGFEKEIKNGKVYSYEDCQHRLAALESIMLSNHINDEDKLNIFLSVEVPVYIVKNKTKEELAKKFSRVNSGKTVSFDHTLYIESGKFNQRIKNELILNSKLVKSIYGIKKKGEFSEKVFYGNVVKMLKVCGHYDGLSNSHVTTKHSELLSFVNTNKTLNSFNHLFDLFNSEWYEIIKDSDKKKDMWKQSAWYFILHINQNKKLNYDSKKLTEIYDNFVQSRHVNTKTGAEINITRCSPEVRYKLILKTFGYEG